VITVTHDAYKSPPLATRDVSGGQPHRPREPWHDTIVELHTLGPTDTNLEHAAWEWFRRRHQVGKVVLHTTLEEAIPELPTDGTAAVVACAVYPDLHTLVFGNLTRLEMIDSFVFPTHPMVLAGRDVTEMRTGISHPAPRSLLPEGLDVRMTTSNAQAAINCSRGGADCCVTTAPAAARHGLRVLQDYGPVPMVFTVHWARMAP
jgi:hypothetical protein